MASKASRQPTIVVTGAAGFAGRHLLDRLAGTGRLVGWRRPDGHVGADRHGAVAWEDVDITRRDSVSAAIARTCPDRIFHLAGAASVAASWDNAVRYLRVNALGTDHILDAVAKLDQPCRVLVVTSAQIYGTSNEAIAEDGQLCPQSPYGLSKLAQDRIALSAASIDQLDVIVARPFNHIGPGQTAAFAISSFARQIARIECGLAPPVISVGNLETRRDMTDVRDVADAYVRIMDGGRRGRAYNVCSGRVWRMRDLLDELLASSTVTIKVAQDPSRFRPVDVPFVQGDPSRIVSELGWAPRIPCEQTLRDALDAWRATVAADTSAS